MAYKQQLITDQGGVFYLLAENYKLPCLEFSSNMSMNHPHSAQVSVSLGSSIKKPGVGYTDDAEALMREVQQHTGGNGQPLIPCQIYETPSDAPQEGRKSVMDKLVFSGYLVQGNLVYATGAASSMQISFVCMGPAAVLYTRPCGASLVEATLGNIISRITSANPMNIMEALMTGDQYLAQPADPTHVVAAMCMKLGIVKRLAICVACAREAYTYKDIKRYTDNGDPAVLAAIGGNVRLSDAIDPICSYGFTEELYNRISTGLPQADIMSAIMATVCSEDYMLQLAPRWTVAQPNDFRMELMPCAAWAPDRPVLKLAASDVLSITMGGDATKALRTPDVVLMNYNAAYDYLHGASGGFSGYVMGVSGNNQKVVSYLRSLFASGAAGGSAKATRELEGACRVQEIAAPKWLNVAIGNTEYTNVKEGKRNDGTDMTVERVAENQSEAKPRAEQASSETVVKHEAADNKGNTIRPTTLSEFDNMIAEALFQYHYMSSDTCVVTLNPALRFGLDRERFFENHIGDTVEVDLTGVGVVSSKIKLRGELQSVSFTASSKNMTVMSYSLQLGRVRLADVKVPSITCPIYTV